MNDELSPLANVGATRRVLEEHGLVTKKPLGQHFLVNDGVVARIVDLAELAPEDEVLEIGPGIGTLTVALLKRAGKVAAVERDRDLPPVLRQTCAPWADRFALLNRDALDIGPGDLPFAPNKFVSNLPYAVAATLVLDVFQRFESVDSATVMVQAEVADRMAAGPGTKDYGAYTVKLALYARPQGRFAVAPGNFFPPPHVESAVIRLDRVPLSGLTEVERKATAVMADAAFAARRKTIANSCRQYFASRKADASALGEVLAQAGIDPRRRGETLSLDEFRALGRAAHARGIA